MSDLVECSTHGSSVPAFVCVHILETLSDLEPRGFEWSVDEDGEYQASCAHCRSLSEEEWDEQASKVIRLLCFGCFVRAAELNGVQLPGIH